MTSVTGIVIDHLKRCLHDDSCSVGAVLPDNWRGDGAPLAHSVTVSRTGGGEYDIVGDNAQLTVNVYSNKSQLDATDYAETRVLPALRTLVWEPAVFQMSVESCGEYPDVQPYRPRYQIGLQLWVQVTNPLAAVKAVRIVWLDPVTV